MLAPPYVITDEEIDEIVSRLTTALDDVLGARAPAFTRSNEHQLAAPSRLST
jgi:hypothetical protein